MINPMLCINYIVNQELNFMVEQTPIEEKSKNMSLEEVRFILNGPNYQLVGPWCSSTHTLYEKLAGVKRHKGSELI